MKYKYKNWAGIRKAEAQIIGQEFERIEDKYEKITPAIIVKEARFKNSPLHKHFEWDDKKAGAAHREQQARLLINQIEVILIDNKKVSPIRAYVNLGEGGNRQYVGIASAMSDNQMREQVLSRAFRELELWQKRYDQYVEFSEIIKVINRNKARRKKRKVA